MLLRSYAIAPLCSCAPVLLCLSPTNTPSPQIEHRFYGESVPPLGFGGGDNTNFLKGLTVEDALADTKAVVDAMQAMYPLESGKI